MIYRLKILSANIVNTFQRETAYFFENWTNLLSTIFYTLTMLLFVDILYANITTLAGYSRNEMLFLVLVGQIAYYTGWGIFAENTEMLNEDIRTGTFDFVLIKPVPSLFFISFRRIPIISMLRDSVPTLIIIFLLINWRDVFITPGNMLWGIFVFICGQIIWQCLRTLFVLPAFWFGNAKYIFSITYALGETHNLPFEGYPRGLRILFTTIIPVAIASAMSGSVMLGKSSGPLMAVWAFAATAAFMFIINWLWKMGLRNYTSASS